MIKFDEWKKIELKTAKILSIEDIPGKDKLYKLEIDLGDEKRTLVAGIKPYYGKEELQGKIIIVVSNLEHRNIAGVESKGMLLATTDLNGRCKLITVSHETNIGEGVVGLE